MKEKAEDADLQPTDPAAELQAMKQIADALASLSDPKARGRVLRWSNERFGDSMSAVAREPATHGPAGRSGQRQREIPGIAKLSENGVLQVTIRDLKAKSANDAALRLAHVLVLANEQLTGSASVSSKAVLVPALRKYRAYDGNTRSALARHRGIVRTNDELSLDAFCRQEAERYMRDILNPAVQGSWTPDGSRQTRRTTTPAT